MTVMDKSTKSSRRVKYPTEKDRSRGAALQFLISPGRWMSGSPEKLDLWKPGKLDVWKPGEVDVWKPRETAGMCWNVSSRREAGCLEARGSWMSGSPGGKKDVWKPGGKMDVWKPGEAGCLEAPGKMDVWKPGEAWMSGSLEAWKPDAIWCEASDVPSRGRSWTSR